MAERKHPVTGMFIPAEAFAVRGSGISKVLSALWARADHEAWLDASKPIEPAVVWTSAATVARVTGTSEITIRKTLVKLIDRGLMTPLSDVPAGTKAWAGKTFGPVRCVCGRRESQCSCRVLWPLERDLQPADESTAEPAAAAERGPGETAQPCQKAQPGPCQKTQAYPRQNRQGEGFKSDRGSLSKDTGLPCQKGYPTNQDQPSPTTQPSARVAPTQAEARRAELAEAHAKLAAEREANRALDRDRPEAGVSPDLRRAVDAADGGKWAQDLWRDKWARALAEADRDLGLTQRPEAVTAVLEAWTAASAGGVPDGVPGRSQIWSTWSKHRDWLLAQLKAAAVSTRPPAPNLALTRPWLDPYADVGLGCD